MFAGSTHDLGVMGSSDHALMFRTELTEVARKFQVLMYTYFFKEGHAFNVLPYYTCTFCICQKTYC